MISPHFPNNALRKKLVVAGIPESEHSMASLTARLPSDFGAPAFHEMSPDALAELILYFTAKGLLTPPVPSDRVLLDLPWGTHVCQFYETKADQLRLLVPYFKQGFDRGEACVWLVSDLTIEEARAALAAAVPDLSERMAKGQVLIKHYTELYTDSTGAVKPAEELSSQFAALGAAVSAQGYPGLRASGSVSWIADEENMGRFMEYETKVNLAIQHARIMAVCTYPAKAAALCRCRELIHNHGKIFVKRGEWVHDKSKDAERIESIFASLATSAV